MIGWRSSPFALAVVLAVGLGAPSVASAAGWTTPSAGATVYPMTQAPYTGATFEGLTNTDTVGTKDYPLQFKDKSYVYVPALATEIGVGSQTAAAGENQKAYFLPSGYAMVANLQMVAPVTPGEKRVYIVKGRFDSEWMSGAMCVPRSGMELLGMNVAGTERAVRGTGPPHYLITSGSGSNRTGTWTQSGASMFTGFAIVGYWRDGATTRWKVAFFGFQGCDGQGSLRSGCTTGTGVSTERANIYLGTGFTSRATSSPYGTVNFGQTTVGQGFFYWYFVKSDSAELFDKWWDGGSTWMPSDTDLQAVMYKPSVGSEYGYSEGWNNSDWTTTTVPPQPSINASETSLTVGNFLLDNITDIWDGTWAKAKAMLDQLTDWFWFLRVWNLDEGWQ